MIMGIKKIKKIEKEIEEKKEKLKNIKGKECSVYARIVGYFRSLNGWNLGKELAKKEPMSYGFGARDLSGVGRCGRSGKYL